MSVRFRTALRRLTRRGLAPRRVRLALRPLGLRSLALAAALAVPALVAAPAAQAQTVTGLSNYSIVIDPGHSIKQNAGVYGYSEAEKTLGVGLELRRLLTTTTDIRAVYMTRTDGTTEVSLSERADYANSTGASYFHSIHSNAADASARSLFVLWAQLPNLSEPNPPYAGGRAFAKVLGPMLGRSMRIPLSGGGDYGECAFYGAETCRSGVKGSRNYVQSYTLMPSTLSEAGFHTNPTQNLRNMNADWKRMEARTFYWSILKNRGIARPAGRFLMGIVTDAESGLPVNGATVSYAGKSYTTDTYASLFNRYSSDPEELRNGFYYLEEVAAGPNPITVTAPNFQPGSVSVTPVDTFFTITDLSVVSSAPVKVAATTPARAATGVRVIDPIMVTFSRPVAPGTVPPALTLAPSGGGAPVSGTYAWSNGNRTVVFTPSANLVAFTAYTLTLAPSVASPYGYALDGNGDGTAGDAFTTTFTTGAQDVVGPMPVTFFPANTATGIVVSPLMSVTFDEVIDRTSLTADRVTLYDNAYNTLVPTRLVATDVKGKTVVHLVPLQPLAANTIYRIVVTPGLKDAIGNVSTANTLSRFKTGTVGESGTTVDAFDDDFTARWWEPLQSGSTIQTSVVADSTFRVSFAQQNPATGTTGTSMLVKYGWTDNGGASLIREYLNTGNTPKGVLFDTTYTLQAAVYGDGSGTRIRFALDDGCSGASCAGKEVSAWTDVTWLGWRIVRWDLGTDAIPEAWIGTSDKVLNGRLRFDSFQLSRPTTASGIVYGQIAFDDLRIVKTTPVANEDVGAAAPATLVLDAPAPNPTAASARLRFTLPNAAPVRLAVYDVTGREVAVLVDEARAAGTFTETWDARSAAPGAYLVRLTAGAEHRTATVVVQR